LISRTHRRNSKSKPKKGSLARDSGEKIKIVVYKPTDYNNAVASQNPFAVFAKNLAKLHAQFRDIAAARNAPENAILQTHAVITKQFFNFTAKLVVCNVIGNQIDVIHRQTDGIPSPPYNKIMLDKFGLRV